MIHMMACVWFFAARFEDFSPDTWVVRYGIENNDKSSQYGVSVYWAVTTLTTIGYGDITPGTDLERFICCVWMLVGVGFYSFTIGSMTTMMSSIETRNGILNNKLAAINEFCSETFIDTDLKRNITNAIKYKSEKVGLSWEDKLTLFAELPKELRYQISMTMYQGVVKSLQFFRGRDAAFVTSIVPYLNPLKVCDQKVIYN